ncbi:MAG: flagellar basal-body rod protein FlgF [Candidatus Azotimanducaceae bacterium]|jgi:flagellar basal-body rod protein FlgF
MSMIREMAMSGARDTMLAQAVNTHNLANASTPGFRGDLVRFTEEANNDNKNQRVFNGVDFEQGVLKGTNRALDVAVHGKGWIAVQAADGTEAYTRRGDLNIDALGRLRNGAGLSILGNGGVPITLPPSAETTIGTDGTITVRAIGQNPNALATVDRIQLVTVDEDQLLKGDDGLLRLPEGVEALVDADVKLLSGTLESSNVNPIESMVRMIDLARRFESQIKMMQTEEENDQSMTSLLRIS